MSGDHKVRGAVPPERLTDAAPGDGRRVFRTLNGHLVCPTLPVNGWWFVENAPYSQTFNFGFSPDALAVIREHNRLWAAKHGADAVAVEQSAHALLTERVRQINRERGFTDAEIDNAFTAAEHRYAGTTAEAAQPSLFDE